MGHLLTSKILLWLALVPAIAAACSTGGPAASVTEPTPIPQPAASVAPTPAPTPVVTVTPAGQSGGTLTIAALADVPHRDVHQERQETLTALGPGLAYSRLLRLRTGPLVEQPSLLLECDLCQSWKLTSNFAYEFQLRPDVQWQNLEPVNGRELVASDLVYSYQRMQTPGWANETLFSQRGIAGFEALDKHTLGVNLAFLDSDALLSLADGHSKIVAHEVVAQYGDLKDSPVVGTGPWVWDDTVQGVGTTLTANPTYFEEGLPFLDTLNLKIVRPSAIDTSSARERLAAFQAGQLDVLTLPPPEWQLLYASSAEFNSEMTQQAGQGVALTMNVQSPPFDDVAVRRAVLQAIDPWEYIDLIWAGQGSAGIGVPVPDPEWLLSLEEIRGSYLASPDQARDLLLSTGRELPIDIELAVAEFDGIYLELGKQIAKDLRAVGFNPTVRAWNPSHYAEALLGETKEYQLALGALPPTATPNGFMLGLLHSGGPANIVGHHDNELDALIQQQASEFDPAKRRDLVIQIQRHILEQGYMFSPVMASSQWVFDWDLRGFHPNSALSEYNYWSRAWLER
ncbi:MAG: ABC transporter substrate-binding protein [Chloroflexi bacterium]|nr:ABC transporter substrate-binding protein [Chloroflexota bacterium]